MPIIESILSGLAKSYLEKQLKEHREKFEFPDPIIENEEKYGLYVIKGIVPKTFRDESIDNRLIIVGKYILYQADDYNLRIKVCTSNADWNQFLHVVAGDWSPDIVQNIVNNGDKMLRIVRQNIDSIDPNYERSLVGLSTIRDGDCYYYSIKLTNEKTINFALGGTYIEALGEKERNPYRR